MSLIPCQIMELAGGIFDALSLPKFSVLFRYAGTGVHQKVPA